MKLRWLFWIGLAFSVLAMAGCNLNIDAPQTPTVAASPTIDETAIALLATATPSPTHTATPTVTATPSPTLTEAPTITATSTPTATGTASPTLTATNTPTTTNTASPTVTATVTPSPTATNTATSTRTATGTASPTLTATNTPTATNTASPTVTVTDRPTATATDRPTITATDTPTATATARPTDRPTATITDTPVPTRTASPTATITDEPTATIRPTATRTALPTAAPTATESPTRTPTIRPTAAPPTRTPTETLAPLIISTPTLGPTLTFTPFPTRTPVPTSIEIETGGTIDPSQPTPTPTGGVPTLTPLPPTITPVITATAPLPDGNGTFIDPNAPAATQIALPVAPPGETGPSGPVLPEQNSVVVSYAGQIVPLLAFSGGNFGDAALAQGEIFDVNSQGEVAAVGPDRWLYINGVRMDVSPASQFGVPDNLSFGDVVWSPDGQRVAFRVDAANPNEQNAIDGGVWIFEPATRQSWQIFRTGYEGQVAQLHEQRQPLTIHWAPNGTALVIKVTTPLGFANVFMSVDHNVNEFVNSIPYADATWAPDSASLIVSGVKWNEMTVVGRVALDQQWTYTEYLNQMFNGLYMHAAIQLFDGRIAFLGGPTPDAFSLYVMQAAVGAQPVPLSILVNGRMLSAEWNTERTAALVTIQTGIGNRLWIVRIDGTVQDVTPPIGSPASAHWR